MDRCGTRICGDKLARNFMRPKTNPRTKALSGANRLHGWLYQLGCSLD
jgi:hypothetical protein